MVQSELFDVVDAAAVLVDELSKNLANTTVTRVIGLGGNNDRPVVVILLLKNWTSTALMKDCGLQLA